MIQINLLPVREAKRKADVKQNVLELVLALIVVVRCDRLRAHRSRGRRRATRRTASRQMQNDIEQFKPQLDQVAAFRAKKAELQKKIDVIAGLDRARKGPVRVMDELADAHARAALARRGVGRRAPRSSSTGQSLDNELVAVFLGVARRLAVLRRTST